MPDVKPTARGASMERVSDEVIESYKTTSTGTIGHFLDQGFLDWRIQGVYRPVKLVGRALTVSSPLPTTHCSGKHWNAQQWVTCWRSTARVIGVTPPGAVSSLCRATPWARRRRIDGAATDCRDH